MSKKSELKAAMASLQVNVPLNLPRKAPQFRPPEPQEVSEIDMDSRPSLDSEPSLESEGSSDSEPSQETELGQDSRGTQVSEAGSEREGPTDCEPSQDPELTLESEGSQETKGSQGSRPTDASSLEKTARVSKREVLIRNDKGEMVRHAKKAVPAVILVKHLSLTEDGYGALSNRMLDILFQADFDKAEHEIILFTIRESLFWRQEWTDPMSGAELEYRSGISSSSLWTHLKRLTQQGWIERELVKESGKGQAKNRYRLNPDVWGPLFPRKKKVGPETEGSQNSEPSQKNEGGSGKDSRPTSPSGNQTGSSLYKNNSLKTDLKTSLSQAPEALEKRWSAMPDKGSGERESFLNLVKAYGRPVWDHCADVLEYLKTHGDLRKQAVGSPFGLLSKGGTWEIFLGLALAKKAKEESLKRTQEEARNAPVGNILSTVPPDAEEPSSPPPAEFKTLFGKKRGPAYAMKVFEAGFPDMEIHFRRQFMSQAEQWAEVDRQIGPIGKEISDDKAKWITGVQRWFRTAWDQGAIQT